MSTGSDWYRENDVLLHELKHSGWSAEPLPTILGYENLGTLGRGGQGVVYCATQCSTGQTVAIKVLLGGAWASERHRLRFEREIDLIAALRHPNIVRLYDGGVTSEGYPYYVMEFIEGVGLDELISPAPDEGTQTPADGTLDAGASAEQPTTIPELSGRPALELFAKVCEAVGHAHQRGMIHRDIKPSNIRIDPQGEPHVLDFGLGKADSDDSDSSAMTLTGEFMGSPPWASPEQTEGMPAGIDARTDVYSLGVVLFQLLTGRFPYPVVGGFREVLDNIKHVEPPPPSTLRKGIDGEIDTIVLKCLAKEPERRYQDADELARDIRHYLADEPIEAKRDSVTYRLRKRLRRHRVTVGLTLALLAVAAVSVVSTLTAWRGGYQSAPERGRAADDSASATRGWCDEDGIWHVNEFLRLRPADAEVDDRFACAVAVHADTIMVGALSDDDKAPTCGAVYVYRFDGENWIQDQKLIPSDGVRGRHFGCSVFVAGDIAAVGAYNDRSYGGEGSGSVYVYRRDGSKWVEHTKLRASDVRSGELFG